MLKKVRQVKKGDWGRVEKGIAAGGEENMEERRKREWKLKPDAGKRNTGS